MARQTKEGLPQSFPDVPPPQYPSGDYSYTIEAVMGIQKSIGQLTQSVETLSKQASVQAEKLDNVCRDIHAAKIVLWIIGGIFAILTTLGAVGFKAVLDHLWPVTK